MPRINLTVDELRMLQDAAADRIDNIIEEADPVGPIEKIRDLRNLSRRVEKVIINSKVEGDE